jgi:hypothetical protein
MASAGRSSRLRSLADPCGPRGSDEAGAWVPAAGGAVASWCFLLAVWPGKAHGGVTLRLAMAGRSG